MEDSVIRVKRVIWVLLILDLVIFAIVFALTAMILFSTSHKDSSSFYFLVVFYFALNVYWPVEILKAWKVFVSIALILNTLILSVMIYSVASYISLSGEEVYIPYHKVVGMGPIALALYATMHITVAVQYLREKLNIAKPASVPGSKPESELTHYNS